MKIKFLFNLEEHNKINLIWIENIHFQYIKHLEFEFHHLMGNYSANNYFFFN